jgi:hypothetical protein
MNKIIIVFAMLTTGCVGHAQLRESEIIGISREKLIWTAKVELKRRNLPLPRDYRVVVENGKVTNEVDASPREVYGVWFSVSHRGNVRALYSVLIDKRSGMIDQVSDLRTVKLQAF